MDDGAQDKACQHGQIPVPSLGMGRRQGVKVMTSNRMTHGHTILHTEPQHYILSCRDERYLTDKPQQYHTPIYYRSGRTQTVQVIPNRSYQDG